jgi:O-antigen/teichoic acid export membrane protein
MQPAVGEEQPIDRGQPNEADRAGPEHPAGDLTGRDRITRNVLASWAGHGVFIIAGFIMPRMIDGRLGQDALGVWDFAWSLVTYFTLIQAGITSSINRYVARCRSVGDIDGINRVVSSVSCVLVIMGVLVALVAVSAAVAVPGLFKERLGPYVESAQWVVLLLGVGMGVKIAFSVFGGVLTGCHRWDLHNLLLGILHTLRVSGMVVALLLDRDLPGLAATYLAGEIVGRVLERVVAYRVLPGLRIRPSLARWRTAKSMLRFGGKSFVPRVAELLLNQTTGVLLVAYLGPASLALFARPRSLILHVRHLITRFAFVFAPTASSMQAIDGKARLRSLLVDATRYGAFVTLPLVLTLSILGGPLLNLWMGQEYANGWLAAALAVGYLPLLLQLPAINILTGLDAHGRPGLANLIAAICGIGLSVVALEILQAGLLGAAAVVLPSALANGIYVPLYACRRFGISVTQYFTQTLRGPIGCALPYGICLVATRLVFYESHFIALAIGLVAGGAVLVPLYWRFALPQSMKAKLGSCVFPFRPDAGETATPEGVESSVPHIGRASTGNEQEATAKATQDSAAKLSLKDKVGES